MGGAEPEQQDGETLTTFVSFTLWVIHYDHRLGRNNQSEEKQREEEKTKREKGLTGNPCAGDS